MAHIAEFFGLVMSKQQNIENKIILFLSLPLLGMTLFLFVINDPLIVFGQTKWEPKKEYYDTETIYARVECADGRCHDVGKKMFMFMGGDANCETKDTESERLSCYARYSYPNFACDDFADKEARQACYDKYPAPMFNYYMGEAGTLVDRKNITINGRRTYFTGFKCDNSHTIMTGTNEMSTGVMKLRRSSRDVEFGNDINVHEDLILPSPEAGVYFGSNVEFGDVRYQSNPRHRVIVQGDTTQGELDYTNTTKGIGITKYNNFNGLNLNRCNDMMINANHKPLMTVPGSVRSSHAGIEINRGLEVEGDVKSDFMWFAGHHLYWTPPIRGNYILYYVEEPLTYPAMCTRPDYTR